MGATDPNIELAALDLDGTLLVGDTVCEAIARKLGKLDRMWELEQASTTEEIRLCREEMAAWYDPHSFAELSEPLPEMNLAPGTREAIQLFHDHGVTTAIVSLTWEFAVEWFAEELGADYYVGTMLHRDGDITHFLPEDKPIWVRDLTEELGVTMEEVVSMGDSASDVQMLDATGQAFFVGSQCPDRLDGARHVPDADVYEIAMDALDAT